MRNVTTFLQNFMVPCRHPSILGTMKSWKYPDIHVAIILFNFHFMTYFVQTCFDISTMCCFYTWGPFFLWRNHQNYVYIYIYIPQPSIQGLHSIEKRNKISQVGPYDLGFTGATLCLCGCIGHFLSFKNNQKRLEFLDVFWERLWGEWNKKQMKIPELFLL